MKKRWLALFLCLALAVGLLAGCGQEQDKESGETDAQQEQGDEAESIAIRVGALKGPTAMGMVELMDRSDAGEAFHDYTFTITPTIDEMSGMIVQNQVDIAAIPANMAAVLYEKTGGAVQALAINTLGVLYIVERGEAISSLDDLAGKTLYLTGKGATPEYTIRYLLQQNGLEPGEDVQLEFKSEPTEVVALLAQNPDAVAMLPEPYVTVASGKVADLRVAIDLTEVWQQSAEGELLTGALVVNADFAEEHPEEIETFLEEYARSVAFINDNVAEGAALVEKYDIVTADVAQKAIPACHMVCYTGQEMEDALSAYLTVLYDQEPSAVGGKLPEDAFYYHGA